MFLLWRFYEVFVKLYTKGILKEYEFVDPIDVYKSKDIFGYCDDYALFVCRDKWDFEDDTERENVNWVFELSW